MRNFTIKPVNEILIALHRYFYNRMKDRSGEGERVYVYICIYMCVCIYIYMYSIWICYNTTEQSPSLES